VAFARCIHRTTTIPTFWLLRTSPEITGRFSKSGIRSPLEVESWGWIPCRSFVRENFSIKPTALYNSLRDRGISKNAAWAKIVCGSKLQYDQPIVCGGILPEEASSIKDYAHISAEELSLLMEVKIIRSRINISRTKQGKKFIQ